MWEYKRFVQESSDIKKMVEEINKICHDGWEVVSVDEGRNCSDRKKYKIVTHLKRKINEEKQDKQILND